MKLLIADDHTLFRDALVQYIERADSSSCVSLAKDFHEALSILERGDHQDLVVLDLRMPGMNGLNGFKIIKERFPDQAVALMSGVAEEEDVRCAINLGAVGYFPKTMSGKALLKGIQEVALGNEFIPEGKNSSQIMPSYYTDPPHKNDVPKMKSTDIKFTPRENDVLSYLVGGASNKEIARALDLQVVTVKLHVRGVCRKLEAKNRTQAALKARDLGIQPISQAN